MFLERYQQLKRSSRFRRTGVGLIAAGLVFAGTAGAPLLLEVQWQAGQVAERVREISSRMHQQETRAIGRLPENAEVKDPLIDHINLSASQARVEAFALVGTAHAAIGEATVPSPLSPQAKVVAAAMTGSAVKPSPVKTVDRMKIPSIKVDMQVAEGMDDTVLNKGFAWKLPYTSTPDKGGNTVIGCHRYLYTSGAKTCFNLDKVKAKDEIVVDWKGMRYYYKVRETKIVKPDDISILNPTRESVLTLFTCTPKFTSKLRLVVIADLVKSEPIPSPAQ